MKNVLTVRELLELVAFAKRPQAEVAANIARVLVFAPGVSDHLTRFDFPFAQPRNHHIHAIVSHGHHTCLALLYLLLYVGESVLK